MTSNFLIFGGSGKVARHITTLLSSQGHKVHSLIRHPSQVPEIESLGGNPIVQSIEDSSVTDLATTIRATSATTIIWSAGAGGKGGPERTQAVDRDGAIKSMDAAARAGVKRYIMVSAIDVRDRETKAEPEWYDEGDRERSDRGWSALGTYMKAKFEADRSLVVENGRRGLEYTIVRPGRLSDEAGRGTVGAGRVHTTEAISREDVARVVVECWGNEGTVGLAFDVVGGEVAIRDAVAEVARGRIDCFDGRY
ncbi:hypothetical protein LTR62_008022 [Meristemomyces frigidus]|uniref:NAD(P)-binding domain-containing protein n=1 Tax=Meristemomyces frigidus TaxID=1508187 RepID=A0AAN7YMC7_9PEZI|nr:hypothetical protein LTR62_008022 [Meristemomyces frigidus]